MSASNNQLHVFAFAGTIVLVGGLLVATVVLSQAATPPPPEPPLKQMVTIEASLARKAETKTQPQKEAKAPEPPPKPEGVSHDENKAPVEPKKDEPKKPPPKQTDEKLDNKFHHASDDDSVPGAVTNIGQFNGSEKGFAPINAGHPYWQNLNADMHKFWNIPSISNVNGAATACLHITPEGKIAEIKMERSGDEILDDSVERAVKQTQQLRNDKPQQVPTEELAQIKALVCFRFKPE